MHAILLASCVLCISIAIALEFFPQNGERVPFHLVVTGDGTGKMGGYFGWVKNPDKKYWYSRHLYANVLPSADIHNIVLLANASGYKTVLTANTVAVQHRVVLYPNNVSIWFSIIVRENGYLTVAVNSDYYLLDWWMRTVFRKMLEDVGLPPDAISQFELAVNTIASIDS